MQVLSLNPRKLLFALAGVLLALGAVIVFNLQTSPPAGLGVHDGRLAACPNSPNCVSTQSANDEQRMAPLPFTGSAAAAVQAVRETLAQMPRMRIVSVSGNYLHAESTSLLFRFKDDLEFYIDETHQLIHFRSASRLGYSDLGANRRRMESFVSKFASRKQGAP